MPRKFCACGLLICTKSPSKSKKTFKDFKERALKMPLEEKRKLYACGENYVTVDKLNTWTNYPPYPFKNLDRTEVRLKQCKYEPYDEVNDRISIYFGDITCLEVDAIVSSASHGLQGSEGMDSKIHDAAGSHLYQECKTLNGCNTGFAKITGGYNLPAKYIIHTVGPIGENGYQLDNCYRRSLDLAVQNNLRTVAFSCVATGAFCYPNDKAAQVALDAVRSYLESHYEKFDRIIFCIFSDLNKKMYLKYLPYIFPKEIKSAFTNERAITRATAEKSATV